MREMLSWFPHSHSVMRVQGLDAVKYWPAYAYGLQHPPQQATGNRIKCLLEVYKAGVQFAMRLFLLVNQRSEIAGMHQFVSPHT